MGRENPPLRSQPAPTRQHTIALDQHHAEVAGRPAHRPAAGRPRQRGGGRPAAAAAGGPGVAGATRRLGAGEAALQAPHVAPRRSPARNPASPAPEQAPAAAPWHQQQLRHASEDLQVRWVAPPPLLPAQASSPPARSLEPCHPRLRCRSHAAELLPEPYYHKIVDHTLDDLLERLEVRLAACAARCKGTWPELCSADHAPPVPSPLTCSTWWRSWIIWMQMWSTA